MKRKILYFIIALIIILSGVYLIRYKLKKDISHSIPKNAVAIVNINIRQIEHHFLADFISNPYSFIKDFLQEKDSVSQLSLAFNYIKLPKNIVFFTKDSLYQTWLSSEIEIIDKENLSKILTNNNFKKKQEKSFTVYQKKQFFVLINTSNMYLGVSDNDQNIETYLNIKEYILKDSELYKHISNSNSDISFATLKNGAIDVLFKNGSIEINGNYNSDLFTETATLKNDSSIANISVSFNKESAKFKRLTKAVNSDKFKKLTQINLDTLLNSWNGNLYFTLNKFKTKIDTIITYTYDDNFNKTENIDIQKDIMPQFNLNLGMQNNLSQYLINSGALKIVEGDSIFTSFPIAKTYISASSKNLNIFTSNKNSAFSKQKNKLVVKINFNKYRQQTYSTMFEYFNNLKSIKDFSLNINSSNKISANFKINSKRNTFVFLSHSLY